MQSIQPENRLTLEEARQRCQTTIEEAITSGGHHLIDALPGLGKTYSAAVAAVEGDHLITYLTHRHDLREEVEKVALDLGLSEDNVIRLKPAEELCPTFRGDHGEKWERDAKALRAQGIMPGDLHRQEALPCQEGSECSYTAIWDLEPDDYKLIIGHPTHSHVPKAVEGRVVIFDEFPREAFHTEIDDLHDAVDPYLEARDDLPFDDLYDLLSTGAEEFTEAVKALSYTDATERDVETALNTGAHSRANLAVWGLLDGVDLGNGYTHADLGEVVVTTWRAKIGGKRVPQAAILTPPNLRGAAGVVALDGTPTPEMWEAVLGEELEHMQVLTDEERRLHLTEERGLRIVQTTEHVKPYLSGRHMNVQEDAALLYEIGRQHEEAPSIVTSKAALSAYREAGVLDYMDDVNLYYGAMKGSNDLSNKRVGAVVGSPHYGDDYVLEWAALLGEGSEAVREPGESGVEYGPIGEKVLRHVREAEVLQATLRFGRDGRGATIYVHTSALPEWVPVEGGEVKVRRYGEKESAVIQSLSEEVALTPKKVAHLANTSSRYARDILNRLEEEVVTTEVDSMDKRITRYRLTGEVNPYGEVNIPEPCECIAQVSELTPNRNTIREYVRNPCDSVAWFSEPESPLCSWTCAQVVAQRPALWADDYPEPETTEEVEA